MKIIVLMITILMFAINSACASHVHQMILFSLKAEHSKWGALNLKIGTVMMKHRE